ncbi:flagellar M-ring protein [Oscillibacter valericigenes Sjm18-20]|nr:flagellar M-ring protein [Oscillibacter valericigenes Sjm18-20]
MQEKLKGFGGNLKKFFAKMSKKARIILGCVLGTLILTGVIFAIVMNNRPYAVLFTGLSTEEISSISTYLNDNGATNFQVQGTDTILVPEAQEAQLKAELLMQGYPTSGFAYETYRKGVGTMSTDSDRQMAYLQDLQDRMAGVIRCMDGVKSAVVTIAQGEDRRYVLDSGNTVDASASVMVTMQSGDSLSDQQATAIRNLVAHAVQGLEIDNIAISDSLGNVYSGGGGVTGASDASELKLQLEEQVNNKVRTQILTVLTPLYGADNVRVAVSSTVDVNHTVGETTQYTLPDWASDGSTNGEGIIGSKVYDQEIVRGDEGTVGGAVGNESNADISTYVENQTTVNGNENYIKNKGETDYNVDTNKQQVERIAGVVSDLMVSVSINSAVSGSVNTTELVSHVGHAAGIAPNEQADKISILLAPFYDPDSGTVPSGNGLNLPQWVLFAGAGGVVLLILLLILLAVLRSKRKKAKQAKLAAMAGAMQASAPQVAEVVPPTDGADIMTIKTEKSIQLRQEIRKFAEDNPEMAAHMLKNWLRGGEEDEQ